MNNDELFEALKRSNDYIVAELQRSEQRTIDELSDKFEIRVRSLEDTRTTQLGMVKTISWVSVTISPAVGYGIYKLWKFAQKNNIF